MDSLFMDRSRGTKWFTFYTKVRPWFACLASLTVITDFFQYVEVYTSYWWMMLYFLGAVAQPVLSIMVFAKSRGDYRAFVPFVKGVLIYETIYMAYSQAVQQYIQNGFDIGIALICGIIILVIAFFVWYRLNIKYFNKRLIKAEYTPGNFDETPNNIQYEGGEGNKTTFCRKCGNRLLDGSMFCDKCGTEVIEKE